MFGDYPTIMKEQIERRSKGYGFAESLLPKFSEAEKTYIMGTYDFFGINSYTAALVRAYNTSTDEMGFFSDIEAYLYQPADWAGVADFKVIFLNFLFTGLKNYEVVCLNYVYSFNNTFIDGYFRLYAERRCQFC